MISDKLKDLWRAKALERLESQGGVNCTPASGSVTRVITWMMKDSDIDDGNFRSKATAAHFKTASAELIRKNNPPQQLELLYSLWKSTRMV